MPVRYVSVNYHIYNYLSLSSEFAPRGPLSTSPSSSSESIQMRLSDTSAGTPDYLKYLYPLLPRQFPLVWISFRRFLWKGDKSCEGDKDISLCLTTIHSVPCNTIVDSLSAKITFRVAVEWWNCVRHFSPTSVCNSSLTPER